VVDEENAEHGIVFQADEAFVQSQQTRGSAKVLRLLRTLIGIRMPAFEPTADFVANSNWNLRLSAKHEL